MISFLLFLLLGSPIKENFKSRNFWKVTTLRKQAQDHDDSLLVIFSMKMMLKNKDVPAFIGDPKNLDLETRIVYTSAIYEIKEYDSVTINNLILLADSIKELRGYFLTKLTEKYLAAERTMDAIYCFRKVENERYRKIALQMLANKLWESRDTLLIDTVLSQKGIGEEVELFLKALRQIVRGDTIAARRLSRQLAVSKPQSLYSLKLAPMLDDTLKAIVFYSNQRYRDADSIFRKLNLIKYPYEQILSAYRTRDYERTLKLYESLQRYLKESEKKQLLVPVGYAYWRMGKPLKALEFLNYSANTGNEIAAREVVDILIKEDSSIFEEYIRNTKAESQELNYALGLYFLQKRDSSQAATFLRNSLRGNSRRIKERALYFLHQLDGTREDDENSELMLDYFVILNRGLVISKNEYEPQIDSTTKERLLPFKYLVLWGDAGEALKYLPDERNGIYEAIRIADNLGNDYLRITLAARYMNNYCNQDLPLYLAKHLFPLNYISAISSIAEFYSLKPEVIISLIREESRFNPQAVSSAGAIGLMQIMPATARRIMKEATPDSLRIPDLNVTLGTKYLSALMDTFPNLIHALCAYNAGESRAREWTSTYPTHDPALFIELIPFRETREYVQRILRSIIIYQYLLKEKR